MEKQTYKQSLKAGIRKLEKARRIRSLAQAEQERLQELYDELDSHQTYLNESGMAYGE